MTTVQIASIPERRRTLANTVYSLHHQADRIRVMLNGYEEVPPFLDGCEIVRLDNSTGDAAKFYGVEDLDGYIFTCDDDLVYPQTYCRDMIEKIEQHQAIITLHGKSYPRMNIDFLRPTEIYRCLGDVNKDVRVDVGGTGVMAWRSDMIKVKYSDFEIPNMSDCFMARLAHQQNVPIIVASHKRGYLFYMKPKNTIWSSEAATGAVEQTKILKSFL